MKLKAVEAWTWSDPLVRRHCGLGLRRDGSYTLLQSQLGKSNTALIKRLRESESILDEDNRSFDGFLHVMRYRPRQFNGYSSLYRQCIYIYVSTNLDPLLHIQIQIPVYPVIKVIIRSNMSLFNLIRLHIM